MDAVHSSGSHFRLRPQVLRAASSQSGPADTVSISSPAGVARITVAESEWYVAEEGNDYVVASGGCGAIKAFVDAGESSYSIVFHSDGTQESKEVAAPQIANYVLRQDSRPESVRILCLQPYGYSQDVADSVNRIGGQLEKAGVSTSVRVVCLDNIEGENFVYLNLKGTDEEILERYDDLRVKSRKLSPEQRAQKIALFQSLPPQARTREFIRNWSSLTLEQAREVAAGVMKEESLWDRLFSGLKIR